MIFGAPPVAALLVGMVMAPGSPAVPSEIVELVLMAGGFVSAGAAMPEALDEAVLIEGGEKVIVPLVAAGGPATETEGVRTGPTVALVGELMVIFVAAGDTTGPVGIVADVVMGPFPAVPKPGRLITGAAREEALHGV